MYSQRRTGVSAAHMLVKVDHFVRMALGASSRKVRERGGTTSCGVRGGMGRRWESVREIMYNCERPAASVDDFCTSEQNAADSAHTRRVTSFHL